MSASNVSLNNMGSQQNLNMNKNQNAANQIGNRGNIRRNQGPDKGGPGGGREVRTRLFTFYWWCELMQNWLVLKIFHFQGTLHYCKIERNFWSDH